MTEYDASKVESWLRQERGLRRVLEQQSQALAALLASMGIDRASLAAVEKERLTYERQFIEVKRTRHNAATSRPKTITATDKKLAQAATDTLGIPYDEALKMAMRG